MLNYRDLIYSTDIANIFAFVILSCKTQYNNVVTVRIQYNYVVCRYNERVLQKYYDEM